MHRIGDVTDFSDWPELQNVPCDICGRLIEGHYNVSEDEPVPRGWEVCRQSVTPGWLVVWPINFPPEDPCDEGFMESVSS